MKLPNRSLQNSLIPRGRAKILDVLLRLLEEKMVRFLYSNPDCVRIDFVTS